MADNVARNLERALPEYEQMKALKIFTDDEIKWVFIQFIPFALICQRNQYANSEQNCLIDCVRNLKKQRENLEYKINQLSPTLKSYCEYLEHMDALASLIRQRQGGKKKHTIISHIAKRMKILYEAATKRFSGVLRMWNEFIKFLTVFGFKNEVSKKLDDMLMVIICSHNLCSISNRVFVVSHNLVYLCVCVIFSSTQRIQMHGSRLLCGNIIWTTTRNV